MTRITLVIAFGMGTCLFLTGCGEKAANQISEKAIEKAIEAQAARQGQDLDVNVAGNRMTVTGTDDQGQSFQMNAGDEGATIVTKDGSATIAAGTAAKLPADWPEDVPTYPGMELSLVSKEESKQMFLAAGTSKDPVNKVIEYLKKQAASDGWAEQQILSEAGGFEMAVYSKDDRTLAMTATADGEATAIQVTSSKE